MSLLTLLIFPSHTFDILQRYSIDITIYIRWHFGKYVHGFSWDIRNEVSNCKLRFSPDRSYLLSLVCLQIGASIIQSVPAVWAPFSHLDQITSLPQYLFHAFWFIDLSFSDMICFWINSIQAIRSDYLSDWIFGSGGPR